MKFFFIIFSESPEKTEKSGEKNGGSLVVDLTRAKVGNTEYTECQAFSPVALIGSPTPHPQENVAPPLWFQGGGGTHSLVGEGAGEPIQTKGQKRRFSRYSTNNPSTVGKYRYRT